MPSIEANQHLLLLPFVIYLPLLTLQMKDNGITCEVVLEYYRISSSDFMVLHTSCTSDHHMVEFLLYFCSSRACHDKSTELCRSKGCIYATACMQISNYIGCLLVRCVRLSDGFGVFVNRDNETVRTKVRANRWSRTAACTSPRSFTGPFSGCKKIVTFQNELFDDVSLATPCRFGAHRSTPHLSLSLVLSPREYPLETVLSLNTSPATYIAFVTLISLLLIGIFCVFKNLVSPLSITFYVNLFKFILSPTELSPPQRSVYNILGK